MAISFPFDSGLVSSGYGSRSWNGVLTFHTGVDFAVAGGRAVPAAEAGTIVKVEYTNLRGYQVEIQHSAAAKTRYHMLRNDVSKTVKVGQYVAKGQTIGHIAPQRYHSSAAWTGPHLHWEVWLKLVRSDGTPYDPWRHVDPRQRWTNAGGTNGYTPSEMPGTVPSSGGGAPLPTHNNESDETEMSLSPRESEMLGRLHDYFTAAEPNLRRPDDGEGLRLIQQSARYSKYAADYVAVGEPGVRNDGQLAALVRSANARATEAARDSAAGARDAALAARDSKYAADYVATGQPGVRNDGQTAALIREGVNAAKAAKLTAADIDAIANAVKAKLQ